MDNYKLGDKKYNNKHKRRALLLVMPLMVFLIFFFITPIGYILYKGFYNDNVAIALPETIATLDNWHYDNKLLPLEKSYKTLVIELQALSVNRLTSKLTSKLNILLPHSNIAINKTVNKLAKTNLTNIDNYKKHLININPIWSDTKIWAAIKHYGNSFTLDYYANALDYKANINGGYNLAVDGERVYITILKRTLWSALLITVLCLLLAYPVAYFIAHQTTKVANILLLFVLLPFWTSFLVRITSWIVILQTNGIVNNILSYLNIIDEPLDILYNQFAAIIAMVHILLPFMLLPIYSVLKGIDNSYIQASKSLGANGFYTFFKVYLPLSMPGIGAGGLLVFIISLGYYITPALLGGIDGQLISNIIAFHMSKTGNWSLAASLSGILFIVVIILYVIYDKVFSVKELSKPA